MKVGPAGLCPQTRNIALHMCSGPSTVLLHRDRETLHVPKLPALHVWYCLKSQVISKLKSRCWRHLHLEPNVSRAFAVAFPVSDVAELYSVISHYNTSVIMALKGASFTAIMILRASIVSVSSAVG